MTTRTKVLAKKNNQEKLDWW